MSHLYEKNVTEYKITYQDMSSATESDLFAYYNKVNKDPSHYISGDDTCTPMECVKLMLDYVPSELWQRKDLKILDPCCGNGNFGAYCKFKTSLNNIWFNDVNSVRLANCKKILNPPHVTELDALAMDSFNQWDLIMANPPYSGGGNKNKSVSKLFIEHSVKLLKNGGYLCFITPNNWMTYNNNNKTLRDLLTEGSFVVIDNDVKKYFHAVGSSFTVFVWQKGVFGNGTYVKNNYLIKDEQQNVIIPNNIPFIPLYVSQSVINIVNKCIRNTCNTFTYRCDLHNYTKKAYLSDEQTGEFIYETVHTAKKTRYAKKKQDIYDKWLIIVPLSTYFEPFIKTKVNVTQSVGYFAFGKKTDAKKYMDVITRPCYKLIIHLTRYGNFNNIMVLKHLSFDGSETFTEEEVHEINKLVSKIKY